MLAHDGFAFLVDPRADMLSVIDILRQENLRLKGILLTHVHEEFFEAYQHLSQASGCPIFCGLQTQASSSNCGSDNPTKSSSNSKKQFGDVCSNQFDDDDESKQEGLVRDGSKLLTMLIFSPAFDNNIFIFYPTRSAGGSPCQ